MYKIQVSYHNEPFDNYPELPWNDRKQAKQSLAKHIKRSSKHYPSLEAKWRLVEISDKEGAKFFEEVVKWHNALD